MKMFLFPTKIVFYESEQIYYFEDKIIMKSSGNKNRSFTGLKL